MKKLTALFFALWLPVSGLQASDTEGYIMPRTEVVPIKDTQENRQYELYIKLPEAYETDKEKRFPVIYTTDAVWHMDLLSGTAEYLLPDAILVGISWQKDLQAEGSSSRPHMSRFRDYSFVPHPDPEIQAKYNLGHADRHLAFLRNQVITYVEKSYRTVPGQRAYLGYSMGAAFGAYVLLDAPDTFSHYILGSPSFDQLDIDFLTELDANASGPRGDTSVHAFLSLGELEKDALSFSESFAALMNKRRGAGLTHSGLQIIKASDHTSAVPETFTRGIKWLASNLTGQ